MSCNDLCQTRPPINITAPLQKLSGHIPIKPEFDVPHSVLAYSTSDKVLCSTLVAELRLPASPDPCFLVSASIATIATIANKICHRFSSAVCPERRGCFMGSCARGALQPFIWRTSTSSRRAFLLTLSNRLDPSANLFPIESG